MAFTSSYKAAAHPYIPVLSSLALFRDYKSFSDFSRIEKAFFKDPSVKGV